MPIRHGRPSRLELVPGPSESEAFCAAWPVAADLVDHELRVRELAQTPRPRMFGISRGPPTRSRRRWWVGVAQQYFCLRAHIEDAEVALRIVGHSG